MNFTLNNAKKKNLMKQINHLEWINKVNDIIRNFNATYPSFDPFSDSVIELQLKKFYDEH